MHQPVFIQCVPVRDFGRTGIVLFLSALIISWPSFTRAADADSSTGQARQQAMAFVNEALKNPDTSAFFPNIKPALFLENLRVNIANPLLLYQGSNTNFCAYAALSYLPLHDDPLGWAHFMMDLYRNGKATWGTVRFEPAARVRLAAGTLVFKGVLDIRPADQLWFLVLADHFKSYLNIINWRYDPGDENTFWAAVNFGKFNRMIRQLLHYEVVARGSDLLHPCIGDLYTWLSESLKTGTTFLYVNNSYLHKKNHSTFKTHIPTHFLVLNSISRNESVITITYWDYGGRSLREVNMQFLKKIIFGVSHCTKSSHD